MRVIFVHGACITDGAWWWHRMVEPLSDLGLATSVVDLPSEGGSGDLYGDSAALRAALDAVDEPVILCGHSYGGRVVADASSHPAVERVVHIATVMPSGGFEPNPWMDIRDGTAGAKPGLPAELMFHDCPEVFDDAMKRLTRTSLTALGQFPRVRTEVPSVYVVCADDRWTPPALQRQEAMMADKVVEIMTGHHPHLAQPAVLAGLISG